MVNMKKKKLTKAEKIAEARKIIDSTKEEMARDKKRMNKAQAVHYDEHEAQELINTKLQAKVQRQNDYREQVLKVNQKHAKLLRMNKLLEEAIKVKDGKYEVLKETVEWAGVKQYTDVLVHEYELERHYYKMAILNKNYLKRALENDELSAEDIAKVEQGEFVSTEKALEEGEDKLKKLKKADEE